MKIYIKNSVSETKPIPEKYVIDVCYEIVSYPGFVSADTEIRSVNLQNGTADEQALADYDAFIDNIYACLINRFEIVEIEESPRSKTSWYFWIYAKDSDGNIATKFLVRLRVSDHEYSEGHSKKAEHNYVERKAQEFKRPASKKRQDWKIKNIVINNDKYYSYEEAEDAIYEKMDKLSRELNNKEN